MANITWIESGNNKRKRAKVTYECKTLTGERKRKSKTFPPGTPKREIDSFIRKVEEDYENSEGLDYAKRTLEQFIGEYLELYKLHLSPTTYKGYFQMSYSEKHGIVSNLGRIDLSRLKTMDIQRYANYLMEEGLSPKTIKNYILFIHVLYDVAMKMGYVRRGYNIVSDVVIPKWNRQKVESYSDEEIRELLRLVDLHGDELTRLIIYLAVGTGMRRSEMAALKIDSVDFQNRILNITHAKVEGKDGDVMKEPKSHASIRSIPIGDALCRELKHAVNRYKMNKLSYGEGFTDEGFIFSHQDGRPISTNSFTAKYIKFMKKYAKEIRYLPLHTAGRHSFASITMANGVDVKCVQELLGHADASTTLNIYSNSFLKQKQECADKVDALLFSKEA